MSSSESVDFDIHDDKYSIYVIFITVSVNIKNSLLIRSLFDENTTHNIKLN